MNEQLQIGFKKGCITVIGGYDTYQQEEVPARVAELEEQKERFLRGEKLNNNFSDVETYNRQIEAIRNRNAYKCQCKCGRKFFWTEEMVLSMRHRYCAPFCGMRLGREEKVKKSYPRYKHPSYDWLLLGKYHDTLHITECLDEHYEGEAVPYRKNTMGSGYVYVYKLYKCKCILCNAEYELRSDMFEIRNDYYGSQAEKGYYSRACCKCHTCSSFQWRTAKILNEHNVSFRAEYSFSELYGSEGINLLRFDFVVFNEDGSIKCLIECQGQQHSEPVVKFGGQRYFERQQVNDEIKRKYAKGHEITLVEIPYTANTYEKTEKFLLKYNVI